MCSCLFAFVVELLFVRLLVFVWCCSDSCVRFNICDCCCFVLSLLWWFAFVVVGLCVLMLG